MTEKCICLKIIGDNGFCPVHGPGMEDKIKEEENADADREDEIHHARYGS